MSAREIDLNGFITIKRNPISKVGVFPYLGKSIDPKLEPNKIYWVYRPAEELGHPDCINSFKMVPIIEDHTMLGRGQTPAEEKGVEGTTGQQVELDGDILYADLKIFSESMKRAIDEEDKTELSMGYRVGHWDPTPGMFDGQQYDFIQRKIRGNHIALVDEGRMGAEIAVLDGITFDAMEVKCEAQAVNPHEDNKTGDNGMKGKDSMAEEEKMEEKKSVTIGDVHAFIKDNAPMWDEIRGMMAGDVKEGDTEEKEGDQTLDETEEKKKDEAMDAAISGLRSELAEFKKTGMKALMSEINQRNVLATEVAECFGTFDHAEKTAQEVAVYGLTKAGIKAPVGHEISAWNAFSAGRKANRSVVGVAMDHKEVAKGSLIEKTLNASK